jgi:hypothetical protein
MNTIKLEPQFRIKQNNNLSFRNKVYSTKKSPERVTNKYRNKIDHIKVAKKKTSIDMNPDNLPSL